MRERLSREVAIRLKGAATRDTLEALGQVFARHRGDRRVSFELEVGTNGHSLRVRAEVSAQIRVRPSPALVAELEQIVGPGAVEQAMPVRARTRLVSSSRKRGRCG